jgi:hypothetical protein
MQQQRQQAEGASSGYTRRLSLPYLTRAQIEGKSPSRALGIDAAAELKWRLTTSQLLKDVIKRLKL